MMDLKVYKGQDEVISSSVMRGILEAQAPNQVRFNSGINGLDELIGGFEGGELIVITGITKNGKTLLAQNLTMNFLKQKIYSLWISFEVPIRQFLNQIPKECEIFIPKMLIPHKPTWLEDRIVESKLKYNTRAVFIDHLHYLVDLEKTNRNISIDIGSVVRGLKRSAVKHNIVIFLLCHTAKINFTSGEFRELSAMDARDSSFIPQEADSTWIIQRRKDSKTDEFNNRAMLKVCNHRRTGVMEKRIVLEKVGFEFREVIDEDKRQVTYFKDTLDGGKGNDSIPF